MHLATNNSITQKESLSVLIHQDGLSFYSYNEHGVVDQLNHHFPVATNPISILKAIKELHKNTPLLQHGFEKVRLFYHHELFSLVPSALFEPKNASDYLKYNVHLLATDVLSHDTGLANDQTALVYIAYENINNYFFEKYGQFEYFHYASCIINHLATPLEKKPVVVTLEIFERDFYLTIFKNDTLICHNLFKHETIEDILYYVMFSIQQNELDPDSLHCFLKSKQELSKLCDLLYHYIRNVELKKEDYNNYLTQILCV
jgi:hypothetical protein